MLNTVSIVIPLYNRAQLVVETLISVARQTYANFQCIVVDDHSTDNSLQVCREWALRDSRFSVHKRQSAVKGACVCRNEGLALATGEYVMFLDSDDLLDGACLQRRVDAMAENPELDFIVMQIGLFYDSESSVRNYWSSLSHRDDLDAFINSEGWQTSSTFFRRPFLSGAYYDESALSYQDVDFHIRLLLKRPKYKKFPESSPDVFIRVSAADRISTGNVTYARIASRIAIYKKLETLMEANGYNGYLFPYMIYNFKYLEIAARLLPDSEFQRLLELWKGAKTYNYRNAGLLRHYLVLQAALKKYGLWFVSAFLYRVAHLFIPSRLIRAGMRRPPIARPVDITNLKANTDDR